VVDDPPFVAALAPAVGRCPDNACRVSRVSIPSRLSACPDCAYIGGLCGFHMADLEASAEALRARLVKAEAERDALRAEVERLRVPRERVQAAMDRIAPALRIDDAGKAWFEVLEEAAARLGEHALDSYRGQVEALRAEVERLCRKLAERIDRDLNYAVADVETHRLRTMLAEAVGLLRAVIPWGVCAMPARWADQSRTLVAKHGATTAPHVNYDAEVLGDEPKGSG
jgi:hypothetical protein